MSLTRKLFLALVVVALAAVGISAHAEEFVDSSISTMLAEQSERIRQLEAQMASYNHAQAQHMGGDVIDESCDSSCRGFIAGGEVTYLKAHSNALSISAVTGGSTQLIPEYGYLASPRVWLGYEFGGGAGIRATYWGYDQSIQSQAFPVLTGLEATTVDLELTQQLSLCSWDVQFSGGARYGRIAGQLGVDVGVPIFGSREFEGVGGTLGVRVRRPVGSRGFAVIGGARGSLVYGTSDASLDLSQTQLPFQQVTITKDQSMLEIYELRMGGEWSRDLSNGARFYTQIAYEAQAWNVAPIIPILETPLTGFSGVTFTVGLAR